MALLALPGIAGSANPFFKFKVQDLKIARAATIEQILNYISIQYEVNWCLSVLTFWALLCFHFSFILLLVVSLPFFPLPVFSLLPPFVVPSSPLLSSSLLSISYEPSLMNLRTCWWGWYVISPFGTPDLRRLTHFRGRQFLSSSDIVLSHTVISRHQHFCAMFITLKLIYILMLSVCLMGVSLVLVAEKKL